MSIIIKIGQVVLQIIFDIHKIAPVRNRITIISRQSNQSSIDIDLLAERIKKEMPDYEVTVLCRKLDNKVTYLGHMITTQMHSIATSKAVLLDSYCIPISFLRQRDSLKVIQMWHAMGAYKKFGKSILGQSEGSSVKIAELMHMHRGYDKLLASSETGMIGFAEAFGYGPESFEIIPLPRTDLLRSTEYKEAKRAEILDKYPILKDKKNILFAPTFRKSDEAGLHEQQDMVRNFASLVDYDKYNLVLSSHPSISRDVTINGDAVITGYTTMELMTAADYFVTDYSATIYEAAVMGIASYIYAYDLDKYVASRGFYLDPYTDLPAVPYKDAGEVIKAIDAGQYDYDRLREFANRNVIENDDCTGSIVDLIKRII